MNKTIPMLLQATSILGSEQMEAVQAGVSVRVTISQIAAYAGSPGAGAIAGVAAAVPAPGANNDYTATGQMGVTIAFMDLTPAGTSNITGVISGFDGQELTITNLSGNSLTINALNAGSQSQNQFRMPADVALVQYQGISFKYSATIGKWVAL